MSLRRAELITPPLLHGAAPPHGILPAERFSCFSHGAGAIAAVAGTVLLVVVTWGDPILRTVSLVYGAGAVFMFTASALYHAHKRTEGELTRWRRLDHVAVFFMIAGTFTPICYVFSPSVWFLGVVGAQWSLVALGLVFKLLFLGTPRWVSASIYVAMGWMALLPLPGFLEVMSIAQLILVISGGLFYTGGAVIYALKRPNPWPGVVGFHGIWHLFVLVGAGLHYLLVYSAVAMG